MLFHIINKLIVAKALPVLNTHIYSIHITRITTIVFLFASALSLNSLNLESIGSGIGIYSGLFQVTSISQLIEIFLFLIGGGILIAWPQIKHIIYFPQLPKDLKIKSAPAKQSLTPLESIGGSSIPSVRNNSNNKINKSNNNSNKRSILNIDSFYCAFVCLVFLLVIYYMFESYFTFIITFYISFLISLYISDNFKYSSLYFIRLNQKFAITIIILFLLDLLLNAAFTLFIAPVTPAAVIAAAPAPAIALWVIELPAGILLIIFPPIAPAALPAPAAVAMFSINGPTASLTIFSTTSPTFSKTSLLVTITSSFSHNYL